MNISQLISRSTEGFVFGTGSKSADQTVRGISTLARDLARRSIRTAEAGESSSRLVDEPALAARHDFLGERPGRSASTEKNFLHRLEDLGRRLSSAHDALKAWSENQGVAASGVEWLLDNYFVIQKHLEEVQESIPGKYLDELPKIQDPGALFAGSPRVFILAGELVRMSAGVVNMDIINVLIREFQTISSLSMGEMWAFPNFLRVALLGNISRAAQRLVDRIKPIAEADEWSARLSSHQIQATEQFVAKQPQTDPTFLLRLMSNLRAARMIQAISLLDAFLHEEGLDLEDLARTENARIALINVTMQHSITSLRSLSGLDWRSFFERHNVTEEVLRNDPFYPTMTFTSRDIYRHAVEGLAKGSNRHEMQVAQVALEMVASAPPDAISHCFHVGYYLVGEGRKQLERVLEYKPKPLEAVVRFIFEEHPYVFYFGFQLIFTALLGAHILSWFSTAIADSSFYLPLLVAGVFVIFFMCNDVAISLVHQLVTNLRHPKLLPRLDFRKTGIPAEYRTCVVVPLLFNNPAAAKKAVDQLEVQFLANRSDNVNFILLSDFCDAQSEVTAADADILDAGVRGIEALNARYSERCFYLFHRPRLFNAAQGPNGVWMAWERKRGKLVQFNQFLLHGADDKNEFGKPFMRIVGDVAKLRDTVFVVTLDADTIIPRNGVARMVGSAAHPLNRAVVSKDTGFVTKGYGVLQPRMTVRLQSDCSKFAAAFSGNPGIDPYTTAVSDVYQDLFSEGTFTGKGIYDVDAFEKATQHRFAENTILSHDLIESAYARSGLVTDVEFFDDFPSHYIAWSKRKHRWVRGDWQLLRWAFGLGSRQTMDRIGRISPLNRWKIIDNLRRSLTEISQLLWFALLFVFFPLDEIATGILYAVLLFVAPFLSSITLSVLRPPTDKRVLLRNYYNLVYDDAKKSLWQAAVMFCFIPHQTLWVIDAIIRTLFRLVVRRNLLEWTAMSLVEAAASSSTARAIWMQMWEHEACTVFFALTLVVRLFIDSTSLLGFLSLLGLVFPLLGAWLAAPHFGNYLSTTSIYDRSGSDVLTDDDQARLLRYGLLHWRFVDEFANRDSNWLIPDNVQEIPKQRIAMRTSPTNIAMQLMSIMSAYDLGFIPLRSVLDRLQKAFDSLEKLERYKGHWFNWYGIDELRTLAPKYVSSVDSGNLGAGLVAVSQGLRTIAHSAVDLNLLKACRALIAALRLVARLMGGTKPPPLGTIRRNTSSATLRSMMAGEGQLQQCIASMIENVESFLTELESPTGVRRLDARRIKTPLGVALDLMKNDDRSNSAFAEGHYWLRWCASMIEEITTYSPEPQRDLQQHAIALAERAVAWVREMDFGFLLHQDTMLLSIGYDVDGHRLDKSSYDLLASESRTTSYLAISLNQVPADHWFKLDRSLAPNGALISWSGTMFEYLMPLLWLENFEGTLWDRTYRVLTSIHKKYAARIATHYQADIAIPWGMSESALNRQNTNEDYQYRAFGIPTIALKRGQDCDYVVAPYASMLALMTSPRQAIDNLVSIEHIAGGLGPYGFRDAIDFTRPDPYSDMAVVRNFMAHHIGMSLTALTNVLCNNVWRQRFHSNPLIASSVLLLHERAPQQLVSISVTAASESDELRFNAHGRESDIVMEEHETRTYTTPYTAQPRVTLLGTFPYTVMITHSGSGFSQCDGMALYRWRNDSTQDNKGMYIYVRKHASNPAEQLSFSATFQPTCVQPDDYRAIFAVDNAHFQRKDGLLSTWTRVAVSTTHRAEVRLVSIRNLDFSKPAVVDLTSYAEIVLQSPVADRAHRAFGNLFIETEWIGQHHTLIARRRPRSERDVEVYGAHLVSLMPATKLVGDIEHETNRFNFIGRGRSLRHPMIQDFETGRPTGETGAVIDPIFCLRATIEIPAGKTETVAFTSFFAPTREEALQRAEFFSDFTAAQQVLDIAASEMKEELVDINLTAEQAMVFQSLFGHMLFRHSAWSPSSPEQFESNFAQDALWPLGISGDWPILLVMIETEQGLETLRKVLIGHRYWRRKGVTIDLVIVNMQPPSYQQDLQDSISHTIQTYTDSVLVDRTGGVFLRRRSLVTDSTFNGLCFLARVHISADQESLSAQSLSAVPDINWNPHPQPFAPADEFGSASATSPLITEPAMMQRIIAESTNLPKTSLRSSSGSRLNLPPHHHGRARSSSGLHSAARLYSSSVPSNFLIEDQPALRDWNSYGGLTEKDDYEIRIVNRRLPPAPWSNVIGTPERIGFLVTETGGGFSWVKNSCMYRLTPWHNDPVTDTNSDIIYLRDDSDGEFWSMTPAPVMHNSLYTVTHSPGKTVFCHEHKEIRSTLTLSVDVDLPVKISLLELRNTSDQLRRLTLVGYVEWVLGQLREHAQHQVVSNLIIAPSNGHKVLVARRSYDPAFANFTAFFYCSQPLSTFTCDRREFIGRNRSLSNPIGLSTVNWMELIGDKLDPCGVSLSPLTIEPGETVRVVFLLGAVEGKSPEIFDVISKLSSPDQAAAAIERTTAQWERRLDTVQVKTPDLAMCTLLNRWGLYQTLSCRIWARSAFYQSGGAFGFRDQLQDMMALCLTEPQLVREHLILSTQRQFEEGDVLHWWHEPTHRGVRTHISDDLVFLPFVLTYYVRTTGDTSLLSEITPYCVMRDLAKDQADIYDLIRMSEKRVTIYDHCVRAFERACTHGTHNLPLMGHGDWNDGMNCVGLKGQGESVWLAWFLTVALRDFAEHICPLVAAGEADRQRFLKLSREYAQAANEQWDGAWFRRAYFDSGAPLGSSRCEECKIDSIAQTWSILSDGVSSRERGLQALASLDEHLIDSKNRVIKLLTPPFDKCNPDPGYIRGYLPGVRENGAQYTHAAVWTVLANAHIGRAERAIELYRLINPLTPSEDQQARAETYKVEPYVICADVYSSPQHIGRGGWTWYTGSAAWMYRAGLEYILGFKKLGDFLEFDPSIPAAWKEYSIDYRFSDNVTYKIVVQNPHGVNRGVESVTLDQHTVSSNRVPLQQSDTPIVHDVLVTMGNSSSMAASSSSEASASE